MGARYGAIVELWRRNWERFIPFLAFPSEIRKIIYTTNAIESLNYQLRKATKTTSGAIRYSVHMKRTKEHTATDDLADVLVSLPMGITVKRESNNGGDLVVVTPDGRRLVAEVKSLKSPSPSDVARLGRHDPRTTKLVVLVSDRLIPLVRDQLSTAGWGWLDRRGHLYLVADGLLVDTDVDPLIPTAGRSRPVLDTDVGLDVASAILADPAQRRSVRALVAYTGRSLGAVHQAMRGLADEGLLRADGGPLTPELFWEVSAHWRPLRVPLAAAPEASGDRRARQLGLKDRPTEVTGESGWALCDTLAANAYGASAVVRGDHPPDFYVGDERTIRVARQLLGDPMTFDRRAATVAIPPATWVCGHRVELSTVAGRRRKPTWPAAHPVIVALDLSIDAGRGREILDDWSPPEPFTRVW